MEKLKWFISRWQEAIVWMPILVIIALAVWLLAGALDRLSVVDSLALLVQFPIVCLFALGSSLLSYLIWRRWSIRLNSAQLDDYWRRLMNGEKGAIVVFIVNAGFYLCNSIMLLWFFSLVF